MDAPVYDLCVTDYYFYHFDCWFDIKDEEIEYNITDATDVDDEPQNSIEDLLNEEEKIVNDDIDEVDDEIDEDEADLFSLIDSMYEEKGE